MKEKTGYRIQELDPADTNHMLEFRNRIFSTISRDHWEAMGCTAVVAKYRGSIRGAIPLQLRDFMLNPHVCIPVVFENAVGVAEKYRSRGIGTAMLNCAADFIQDRAFALCVYRSGERSDGYRFYRKTDHGDLYYATYLRLPVGSVSRSWSTIAQEVDVYPWNRAKNLEKELLSIFNACYGSYGGFWKRTEGYFKRVIASHVYKEGVVRLYLFRRKGEITAYSIVNPGDQEGCYIYDVTSRDRESFHRLMAKMALDARENGQDLKMLLNREHPFFRLFLDFGFEPESNEPYIMGRILRADRIFQAISHRSNINSLLELKAVTPHRDLVLNDPPSARHTATLYLKENQLSRLLFCRLDLSNALRTNLVRISPVSDRIASELCRIFAFCPWVTSRLDYI
jgi:GNAT superfamily N-acetyltransferase